MVKQTKIVDQSRCGVSKGPQFRPFSAFLFSAKHLIRYFVNRPFYFWPIFFGLLSQNHELIYSEAVTSDLSYIKNFDFCGNIFFTFCETGDPKMKKETLGMPPLGSNDGYKNSPQGFLIFFLGPSIGVLKQILSQKWNNFSTIFQDRFEIIWCRWIGLVKALNYNSQGNPSW